LVVIWWFFAIQQTSAQTSAIDPITDIVAYQNLQPLFVTNVIDQLTYYGQNNNPNERKKYLIKNFCDTMLNGIVAQWFQHDTFYIDPTQSYFLYYLCVSVDSGYQSKFPKLENLVISSWWRNEPLWLKSKDVCNSNQINLWDCPIYRVTTPLLYAVLDDLYHTKYATLQLYQWPEIKPESYIKSYSRRFFTNDLLILPQWWYCNQAWYYYIYPDQIADHKSHFCSHPKVFNELKDISKNAISLIKKNKIAKATAKEMYISDEYDTDVSKSDYTKFCNIYTFPNSDDASRTRNVLYDLVRCAWIVNHENSNIGLSEYQKSQGSLQAFYNLEYNELLIYKLFITYYILVAQSENQFQWSISQIRGTFGATVKAVADELDQLNIDRQTIQNKQSEYHKALWDMRMSFHLYVTHRIYQEDLTVFNTQYSKVATQTNQLKSKFYKAQDTAK
jgi:hypothetical protein